MASVLRIPKSIYNDNQDNLITRAMVFAAAANTLGELFADLNTEELYYYSPKTGKSRKISTISPPNQPLEDFVNERPFKEVNKKPKWL